MESFMDKVEIESIVDIGTKITMEKYIKKENILEKENTNTNAQLLTKD